MKRNEPTANNIIIPFPTTTIDFPAYK